MIAFELVEMFNSLIHTPRPLEGSAIVDQQSHLEQQIARAGIVNLMVITEGRPYG